MPEQERTRVVVVWNPDAGLSENVTFAVSALLQLDEVRSGHG